VPAAGPGAPASPTWWLAFCIDGSKNGGLIVSEATFSATNQPAYSNTCGS